MLSAWSPLLAVHSHLQSGYGAKFVGPHITMAALRTPDSALVGARTIYIVSRVDRWGTNTERHCLGKATIVLQRTEKWIHIQVRRAEIAALHNAMANFKNTVLIANFSARISPYDTVHELEVAIEII